MEYANSATSGKVYTYGHTLISQGNSWYYLYNAHGDVVKYINANGAVLQSYDYDAFGEEADPSTTDANPFRYAGQYFDDETGTYYLRARYYNPGNGRFTQQDSWGYADPADPLSLNLYVYCYGNPVKYYDPSGNIPLETVADVLGAVGSLVDFIRAPSAMNALYLLWDVASIAVPYVPGSYVAKVAKTTAKIIDKIDDAKDWLKAISKVDNISDFAQDFLKTHDRVLGSYKDLKKLVKKLGVKGLEVHHLIEKRFAGLLNVKENAILSVALDEDTHQKITNAFRQAIGYVGDKNPKITTNVDIQELWLAIVEVYSREVDGFDLRVYLGPLKEWFIKNVPNVGAITDWGGY